MPRTMLVNVVDPEESRIGILENNILEELYLERVSSNACLGNVYKAKIVNIERSIQAAFVDFGGPKNGFLHISDIIPEYKKRGDQPKKTEGQGRGRRSDPLIQTIFKRGDEVLVQVNKDSVGHKGPTVTTYLSIPGRFLVLMPHIKRMGVSRKIGDDEERKRLREALKGLDAPEGLGFIVRTAGMERNKQDLSRDMKYLTRLWETLNKRERTAKAPALLYQESDLVIRTIRDYFTNDIDEIIVDSEPILHKILDFMKILTPRLQCRAVLYKGAKPLFHKFGIEKDLEAINDRVVPLKSGGSISIDRSEAMVTIDVNSGRSREKKDPEKTSLVANLEAAREVARQLRLRDLGGLILIDFIDMKPEKNQRAVEKELREELKKDKARTRSLKISKFGIVEMTRQRIRPAKTSSSHEPCPVCSGTGFVKSADSIGLETFRKIRAGLAENNIQRVEVRLAPAVCTHLQNARRSELAELEAAHGKPIRLVPEPEFTVESTEVTFFLQDGKKSRTV